MTRSRPESQSSFRQPVETVKAPCTLHFYYSTEFGQLANKNYLYLIFYLIFYLRLAEFLA